MSDQEALNFCRLSMLIVDTGTKVLLQRINDHCTQQALTFEQFLNKQNNKHSLYHLWQPTRCCQCSTLRNNSRRILSKAQFDVLYNTAGTAPAGHIKRNARNAFTQTCCCGSFAKTGSKIDITLASCILINLCSLSQSDETAINDFRDLRNTVFGHVTQAYISNTDFNINWQKVESVLLAIVQPCSVPFKTTINNEIQEIKERLMEPQVCSTLLETFRQIIEGHLRIEDQLETGFTETRETLDHLSQTSKRIKINNINNMNVDINGHERTLYMPTRALAEGEEKLKTDGLVVFTGICGSGKTSHSLELLSRINKGSLLPDTDCIVYITSLIQWDEFIDPNQNTVVFLEDVIGNINPDLNLIQNDKGMFRRIWNNIKTGKIKVIATVHANIIEKAARYLHKHQVFYNRYQVNLSEGPFQLNESEKESILKKYFNGNNVIVVQNSEDENLNSADVLNRSIKVRLSRDTMQNILKSNPSIGFPLCCENFVNERLFLRMGKRYFESPSESHIQFIRDLALSTNRNETMQFVCLFYILLMDGEARKDEIDQEVIREIAKDAGIIYQGPIDTARGLDNLKNNNMVSELDDRLTYKIKHRTLLDATAFAFGDLFPDMKDILINCCDSAILYELFRAEGQSQQWESEYFLEVPKRKYHVLAKRFITEIMKGNSGKIVTHSVMSDDDFLTIFISVLQEKENVKIVSDINDDAMNDDDSSLFALSCLHGAEMLVFKLLSLSEIVPGMIREGCFIAIKYGNVSIVKILLPRMSQEQIRVSFLEICRKGNLRMLEIAISHGGEDLFPEHVRKGFTSLCQRGLVESVQYLLLETKELCHEAFTKGLIEACIYDHLEVMKVILNQSKQLALNFDSVFIECCRLGRSDFIKTLLTHDIDISNETVLVGFKHSCNLNKSDSLEVILKECKKLTSENILECLIETIEDSENVPDKTSRYCKEAVSVPLATPSPYAIPVISCYEVTSVPDRTPISFEFDSITNTKCSQGFKILQKRLDTISVILRTYKSFTTQEITKALLQTCEHGVTYAAFIILQQRDDLSLQQMTDIVRHACKCGRNEILQILYSRESQKEAFLRELPLHLTLASKSGHLRIIEFIFDICIISEDAILDAFLESMDVGCITSVNMLLPRIITFPIKMIQRALMKASATGFSNVVEKIVLQRQDLTQDNIENSIMKCLEKCHLGTSDFLLNACGIKPCASLLQKALKSSTENAIHYLVGKIFFTSEQIQSSFIDIYNNCKTGFDIDIQRNFEVLIKNITIEDVINLFLCVTDRSLPFMVNILTLRPDIPRDIIIIILIKMCIREDTDIIELVTKHRPDVLNLYPIEKGKYKCDKTQLLSELIAEIKSIYIEQMLSLFDNDCFKRKQEVINVIFQNRQDLILPLIRSVSTEHIIEVFDCACLHHCHEIIDLMLKERQDVPKGKLTYRLITACIYGEYNTQKAILKHRHVSLNLDESGGFNYDKVKVLNLILPQAENVSNKDMTEWFDKVCCTGDCELIELLLQHRQDIPRDKIILRLLEAFACGKEDKINSIVKQRHEMLQLNLEQMKRYNYNNEDLLHYIFKQNRELSTEQSNALFANACDTLEGDILELLLQYNENISNDKIMFKLIHACIYGKTNTIKAILRQRDKLFQVNLEQIQRGNYDGLEILKTILPLAGHLFVEDIKFLFEKTTTCEEKQHEIVELILLHRQDIPRDSIISVFMTACLFGEQETKTAIVRQRPKVVQSISEKVERCNYEEEDILNEILKQTGYECTERMTDIFNQLCFNRKYNLVATLLRQRQDITNNSIIYKIIERIICNDKETTKVIVQEKHELLQLNLEQIQRGNYDGLEILKTILPLAGHLPVKEIKFLFEKTTTCEEKQHEIVKLILLHRQDIPRDSIISVFMTACLFGEQETKTAIVRQRPEVVQSISEKVERCNYEEEDILNEILKLTGYECTGRITKIFEKLCFDRKYNLVATLLRQRQDLTNYSIIYRIIDRIICNDKETMKVIVQERHELLQLNLEQIQRGNYDGLEILKSILPLAGHLSVEEIKFLFQKTTTCEEKQHEIVELLLLNRQDIPRDLIISVFMMACLFGKQETKTAIVRQRPEVVQSISEKVERCNYEEEDILNEILKQTGYECTELMTKIFEKLCFDRKYNLVATLLRQRQDVTNYSIIYKIIERILYNDKETTKVIVQERHELLQLNLEQIQRGNYDGLEILKTILPLAGHLPVREIKCLFEKTTTCEEKQHEIVELLLLHRKDIPRDLIISVFMTACLFGEQETKTAIVRQRPEVVQSISEKVERCNYEEEDILNEILKQTGYEYSELMTQIFENLCFDWKYNLVATLLRQRQDIKIYSIIYRIIEAIICNDRETTKVIVQERHELLQLNLEQIQRGNYDGLEILKTILPLAGHLSVRNIKFLFEDTSTSEEEQHEILELILLHRQDIPRDSIISVFMTACLFGEQETKTAIVRQRLEVVQSISEKVERCNYEEEDILNEILKLTGYECTGRITKIFEKLCFDRKYNLVATLLRQRQDITNYSIIYRIIDRIICNDKETMKVIVQERHELLQLNLEQIQRGNYDGLEILKSILPLAGHLSVEDIKFFFEKTCEEKQHEIVELLLLHRKDIPRDLIISVFMTACLFGEQETKTAILRQRPEVVQSISEKVERCNYEEEDILNEILKLTGYECTELMTKIFEKLCFDRKYNLVATLLRQRQDIKIYSIIYRIIEAIICNDRETTKVIVQERHELLQLNLEQIQRGNYDGLEILKSILPLAGHLSVRNIKFFFKKTCEEKQHESVELLLLHRQDIPRDLIISVFMTACLFGEQETKTAIVRQRPEVVQSISEKVERCNYEEEDILNEILKQTGYECTELMTKIFEKLCFDRKYNLVATLLRQRQDITNYSIIYKIIERILYNDKETTKVIVQERHELLQLNLEQIQRGNYDVLEILKTILPLAGHLSVRNIKFLFEKTTTCEEKQHEIVELLLLHRKDIPRDLIISVFMTACLFGEQETKTAIVRQRPEVVQSISEKVERCNYEEEDILNEILKQTGYEYSELMTQIFENLCFDWKYNLVATLLRQRQDIKIYSIIYRIIEAIICNDRETTKVIVQERHELLQLNLEQIQRGNYDGLEILKTILPLAGHLSVRNIKFLFEDTSTSEEEQHEILELILLHRQDIPRDSIISVFMTACLFGEQETKTAIVRQRLEVVQSISEKVERCNYEEEDILNEILKLTGYECTGRITKIFEKLCFDRKYNLVATLLRQRQDITNYSIIYRIIDRIICNDKETMKVIVQERHELLQLNLEQIQRGNYDGLEILKSILPLAGHLSVEDIKFFFEKTCEEKQHEIVELLLLHRKDIPRDLIISVFMTACLFGEQETKTAILRQRPEVVQSISEKVERCNYEEEDILNEILKLTGYECTELMTKIFEKLCFDRKYNLVATLLRQRQDVTNYSIIYRIIDRIICNDKETMKVIVQERHELLQLNLEQIQRGNYDGLEILKSILPLAGHLSVRNIKFFFKKTCEEKQHESVELLLLHRQDIPRDLIISVFMTACLFGEQETKTAIVRQRPEVVQSISEKVERCNYEEEDILNEILKQTGYECTELMTKIFEKLCFDRKYNLVATLLRQRQDITNYSIIYKIIERILYNDKETTKVIVQERHELLQLNLEQIQRGNYDVLEILKTILPLAGHLSVRNIKFLFEKTTTCEEKQHEIVELLLLHRKDIPRDLIISVFMTACLFGEQETKTAIVSQRPEVVQSISEKVERCNYEEEDILNEILKLTGYEYSELMTQIFSKLCFDWKYNLVATLLRQRQDIKIYSIIYRIIEGIICNDRETTKVIVQERHELLQLNLEQIQRGNYDGLEILKKILPLAGHLSVEDIKLLFETTSTSEEKQHEIVELLLLHRQDIPTVDIIFGLIVSCIYNKHDTVNVILKQRHEVLQLDLPKNMNFCLNTVKILDMLLSQNTDIATSQLTDLLDIAFGRRKYKIANLILQYKYDIPKENIISTLIESCINNRIGVKKVIVKQRHTLLQLNLQQMEMFKYNSVEILHRVLPQTGCISTKQMRAMYNCALNGRKTKMANLILQYRQDIR